MNNSPFSVLKLPEKEKLKYARKLVKKLGFKIVYFEDRPWVSTGDGEITIDLFLTIAIAEHRKQERSKPECFM